LNSITKVHRIVFHGGDDLVRLWQRRLFKVLGIRHRYLGAADPLDRRIEVEERVLHDASADLGRETACAPRLVDDDGAMRLANGRSSCRYLAAATLADR
jgi:hypothetical protein